MRLRSHAYRKIGTVIERLEQNQMLYAAENFIERMRAIDILELQMLDEIEQATNSRPSDPEKLSLVYRTQVLRQKLDDANERLFAHLLESIRSNDGSTVRQYFKQAEQQIFRRSADDDVGYDELDMLLNGLLEVAFVPAEPQERQADMLFYQPPPARIILKLIDELHAAPEDIFYDLGSGLGHVPILVNLLTGIKTRGIELEESYVHYSGECLKKLGLPNVEFIHGDVRHVAYDDGTIFYMYTPFQGEMLRQVLVKLEAQSKQRPIRVCTYGPCTSQVGRQKWLQPIFQTGKREDRFSIFGSLSL
jgi:Histone methylation protein DOT1